MDEPEPPYDARADLVPALQEMLKFCDGLLCLVREVLKVMEWTAGATPPTLTAR